MALLTATLLHKIKSIQRPPALVLQNEETTYKGKFNKAFVFYLACLTDELELLEGVRVHLLNGIA